MNCNALFLSECRLMKRSVLSICSVFVVLAIPGVLRGQAPMRKLPDTIYEEWRLTATPSNNQIVTTNPTSLLWPSEKHWRGAEVLYQVYVSRDSLFADATTMISEKKRYCFYNLHAPVSSGKWFWKYDIIDRDQKVASRGPFSFLVKEDTPTFETPSFEAFLMNVSKHHPRVMNQGKDIGSIRKKAPGHPLYSVILQSGMDALRSPVYKGPVTDKDPAKDKALSIITGKEVAKFNRLLEAYVISGDKAMLAALMDRIDVLLGWPTNDLLGSQVLTSLAMAYDALFDELKQPVKESVLAVIGRQLNAGLSKWEGEIETRHVENHFWQMEISGNFVASLATVNDLDVSKRMLEYTYELFLARFPNLATEEGGWAEGIGYFGVNKSAIVDMALLMKKVGGCDVFKMSWYRNLADYFLYFAPVDGRISGFGDMHDRVGNGNVGHSMMLVVGNENKDDKALYRLAALMKARKAMGEAEDWYQKELSLVEPWYQTINDFKIDADRLAEPLNLPNDRLFKGVGIASFHTDPLHSDRNTALYFRASPFGAKGHMHANQNCFNLSRRGDPLFYSSGYYTTFADPHSLTSYRHTRAHNGILVNGIGQAFGHEGYGWIKRFISGKNISYVSGDATMAYRPVVDTQFLNLLKENGIPATPESGFGDAKLTLFERHVVHVKPDVVIIYDVLESEAPSSWSFLLHSVEKPELLHNGGLKLTTPKNSVYGFVTGSSELDPSLTDQFYSPPVDIKKKYKNLSNQFHISYTTKRPTNKARFLAILQMSDAGVETPLVEMKDNHVFSIGDFRLSVELDAEKPAYLSVVSSQEQLHINKSYSDVDGLKSDQAVSTLVEKLNGKEVIRSLKDMPAFP